MKYFNMIILITMSLSQSAFSMEWPWKQKKESKKWPLAEKIVGSTVEEVSLYPLTDRYTLEHNIGDQEAIHFLHAIERHNENLINKYISNEKFAEAMQMKTPMEHPQIYNVALTIARESNRYSPRQINHLAWKINTLSDTGRRLELKKVQEEQIKRMRRK